MISVREALDRVLEDLPRVGGEQVPLAAARGRVLAAPIQAPRDVPPFRNSAMDGYAVRSADVTSASATAPVVLRVLETVGAGSVVRVEDTADAADGVAIHAAVGRGNNVREAGEDMRAGETVLEAGRLLRPADIGLLASLGLSMLRVARRPR